MIRKALGYSLGSALAAVVVGLAGVSIVGLGGAAAVALGAGIGLLVQVLLFWVLFVWAFPTRLMLAYGLGVAGRFVVVGWVALVWAPRSGMSAATILFSLVAVLFLSTLLEPVFLKSGVSPAGRSRAVTT